MWFKQSKRYFCKIENFAYGEINERSFSNPHLWTVIIIILDVNGTLAAMLSHTKPWYSVKWYVVTRYGATNAAQKHGVNAMGKIIRTSISLRRGLCSNINMTHIWTIRVTYLDVWSYISVRRVFPIDTRFMFVSVINGVLDDSKSHVMRS